MFSQKKETMMRAALANTAVYREICQILVNKYGFNYD